MTFFMQFAAIMMLLINAPHSFISTTEMHSQKDCPERLGQPTAAFSPDGKYLAATADENTASKGKTIEIVHIWDIDSHKEILSIRAKSENSAADSLAFSPDDKYIVLGNRSAKETTADLWEISTGKLIRSFVYPFMNFSHFRVAFSQDGQFLLTSDVEGAVLWEVETGKAIHSLTFEKGADNTVMSSNAKYIYTQGEDSFIWDISSEKQILPILSTDELSVAHGEFSQDNKNLLLFKPGRFALWDAETKKIENIPVDETDTLGHFSQDGKLLVTSGLSEGQPLAIWDLAMRKKIMTYLPNEFVDAQFSRDNKYIFVIDINNVRNEPEKIHAIDIDTGKELNSFELNRSSIDSVDAELFSPTGEYLFTAYGTHIFKFWRLSTGNNWCL